MTQTDYWSFSAAGGAFSFTVSAPYSSLLGATYGNLHPKFEITNSAGTPVIGWQDVDGASVSWTGNLAAGSYRIVVGSHGISSGATSTNYGFDVGSYTISGIAVALPAVPTGLTATPGNGQVTLRWNASSGASSYKLYRGTTSGGEVLYQSGLTGTVFTDTGVTNGTTYYYQMSAVNSFGESGLSSEVAATPDRPPVVSATQINDASAQRSQVTSLSVTFGGQVSFATTPGAAFTLIRDSDSAAVSFTASATIVGGVTVVTLNNFTGTATQFGSLADGRYTLTALASQISANGQPLDGNGDGTPGDNYTFGDGQGLFRFFGDINGDRHVDVADFGLFSSTFNLNAGQTGFLAAFDFNGDGHVDIADFGQFSVRFFTVLP
jgi:hypothetical protein